MLKPAVQNRMSRPAAGVKINIRVRIKMADLGTCCCTVIFNQCFHNLSQKCQSDLTIGSDYDVVFFYS